MSEPWHGVPYPDGVRPSAMLALTGEASDVEPWSADESLQINVVQCLEIIQRKDGARLGWLIDMRVHPGYELSGHPLERPWLAFATTPKNGDSLLGHFEQPWQAVEALLKNEEA